MKGKTVGVDATTLEANAAMRSIERRDTGESYEAFVRQLAKASGIETPTRAELARFDRSRKDRKTSNKEWQSPQDPDAKIAKMKDGRTHLAHKAEHGVDLETGAILSVTVQDASEGDSATLPETLTMAAEQVEAVQPAGAEVEEVIADKGYHSDATLVALDEIGVRSYVSEPERGRRCWQDKKTGETPVGKRAAQKALYGNRRRIRGDRGRRLQRRRGELVERPFAHQYETGGLRRVWVRGHENVRKRVLIQAAGCNLGLLLRRLTGVGTPRSLQGAGSFGHLRTDRSPDRALGASNGLLGLPMDVGGAGRLNRSSPSCLNRPAQRTAFFHGLPENVLVAKPSARPHRQRGGALEHQPAQQPGGPAQTETSNGYGGERFARHDPSRRGGAQAPAADRRPPARRPEPRAYLARPAAGIRENASMTAHNQTLLAKLAPMFGGQTENLAVAALGPHSVGVAGCTARPVGPACGRRGDGGRNRPGSDPGNRARGRAAGSSVSLSPHVVPGDAGGRRETYWLATAHRACGRTRAPSIGR